MSEREWVCRCGDVRLSLRDVPKGGVPAICYCNDCRAFARLHGAGGNLDAAGGVSLYSTTPDVIDLTAGREHLACERLSARGPLRWFTTCCDTPLGNSAPSRAVPFFSVMADRIGGNPMKPVARLHRGAALGRVPRPRGSVYALVAGVAKRVIGARLSGRWKANPFFGEDGRPIAAPGRPDEAAKRAAYADAP